jgi:RHS repeat-associated protein
MKKVFAAITMLLLLMGSALSNIRFDSYENFFGDVDGDGIADLYLKARNQIVILSMEINTPIVYRDGPSLLLRGRSDGSYDNAVTWSDDVNTSGLAKDLFLIKAADIDGNGSDDLLLQSKHVSRYNAIIYFNNANQLLGTYSFDTINGEYASLDYASWTLEDVNGDKKIDIIMHRGTPNETVGISMGLAGIHSEGYYDNGSKNNNIVVGASPGAVNVSEYNGGFSYSMPLSVPAGIAGVKPQLSISYSSQGGNGILGKGFSLDGLGAVRRCGKKFGVDGQNVASFNALNSYCLNGQRLIPVDGKAREYRARLDGMKKITSEGGSDLHPHYFKVQHKSGEVEWYGNGHNSKDNRNAGFYEWNISRRQDVSGNGYSIHYYGDDGSGVVNQRNVKEIQYGKNNRIKISFTYRNRDARDSRSFYEAGTRLELNKLLKTVSVSVGGEPYRTYNISFGIAPVTASSRVTSIQECGANGHCFQPTNFTWNSFEGTFGARHANYTDTTNDAHGNRRIHIHEPNLCAEGSRNSALGNCDTDSQHRSIQYPDINGDGYSDICFRSSIGIRCELNDGTGNFDDSAARRISTNICRDSGDQNQCNSESNWTSIQYIDMNADGRDDIVYLGNDGIRIYRSTGTGFSFYRRILDSCKLGSQSGSARCKETNEAVHVYYPDLNGDSIPDICWVAENTALYCKTSQSGAKDSAGKFLYSGAHWVRNLIDHDLGVIQFPDLDGDGDQDVLLRKKSGTGAGLTVYSTAPNSDGHTRLTTLINTGACKDSSNSSRDCDDLTGYTVFTGNVNGDQYQDICFRTRMGIRCMLYQGGNSASWINTEFTQSRDGTTYGTGLCGSGDGRRGGYFDWECFDGLGRSSGVGIYDINGDGLGDLYARTVNGPTFYLSNGAGFDRSHNRKVRTHVCKDTQVNRDTKCNDDKNFNTVRVLDINSDGHLDIALRADDGLRFYLNQAKRPMATVDTIKKITNGHGLTQEISYSTLLDSAVYSSHHQGSTSIGNVYGLSKRAIPVVKSIRTKGANATKQEVKYKYSNLKTNLLHGYSGFDSVTAYKGTVGGNYKFATEHHFEQAFPINGNSKISKDLYRSSQDGSWKTSSDSYTRWRYRVRSGSNNKVLNLFVSTTTSKVYEDTIRTQRVLTENYFDGATTVSPASYGPSDFGNVTKHIIKTYATSDAWRSNFDINNRRLAGGGELYTQFTTTSHYDNFANSWILGRLRNTTVTKRNFDGATSTRNSSWQYYDNGLMKAEMFAPGSENQKQTEYKYNGYGQYSEVTTSTMGSQSGRAEKTTYGYDQHQNPYSTTNSKGHTQYVISHDVLGAPEYKISANGFITTHYYDGFGRKTKSVLPTGETLQTRLLRGSGHFPGTYYVKRTESNIGTWSQVHFDSAGFRKGVSSLGPDGQIRYVRNTHTNDGILKHTSLPSLVKGSYPHTSGTESYDDQLRVTRTFDSRGNRTNIAYGKLEKTITNAKGQSKTIYSRPDGKTSKVVQFNDQNNERYIITYTYDVDGNMKTAISEGVTVTNYYDAVGRRIGINDPDKGNWRYVFNAKDEVVMQTSAKGYKTCFVYDELGRKISRYEEFKGNSVDARNYCANNANSKVTRWEYDTATLGLTSSTLKGALHKVIGHDGYQKIIHYDMRARVSKIEQKIKGQWYTESKEYDTLSRPVVHTYPTGLGVRNVYRHGALAEVLNAATGQLYWKASEYDHQGHLRHEVLGNGLHNYFEYSANSPYLKGIRVSKLSRKPSTFSPDQTLMWANYGVDAIGNYHVQHDIGLGVRDDFEFDHLNRLTSIKMKHHGQFKQNETMVYHRNGNINYKPGTGTYHYGETCALPQSNRKAGPHAVSRTTHNGKTRNFCYDANGNLVFDTDRTLTYANTYDKPLTITHNNGARVEFSYNPGRSRYYRKDVENGKVTETFYAGSGYEKVVKNAGTPEQTTLEKHYIAGKVVEIYKDQDYSQSETRYLHKDHLGSVVMITSQSKQVLERHSYDAWGQKRTLAGAMVPYFSHISAAKGYGTGAYHAFKGDFNNDGKQDIYVQSEPSWVLLHGEIITPIAIFEQSWLMLGVNDGKYLEPVVWHNNLNTQNLARLDNLPKRNDTTLMGFTGHEQIESVGIVHMNGRLYDPVLGRMLNADPFIQAPGNSQSFNRYSYVINNPVSLVDPSGYIFGAIRRGANYLGGRLAQFDDYQRVRTDSASAWLRKEVAKNPEIYQVAVIAGCAYTGPGGCAIIQGASTGFLQKDFKAGVKTAAIAYATGKTAQHIGTGGPNGSPAVANKAARVIAHGAVGGVSSVARGGSFGQGAAAGIVSSGFAEYTPASWQPSAIMGGGRLGHAVEGALLGGTTASIMSGGTQGFANGAASGAMARLFKYKPAQKEFTGQQTGPTWFKPDNHQFVVGRLGHPLVWDGRDGPGIGSFMDEYLPAGHTFGANHDRFVDYAIDDIGAPDVLVNFPSMVIMYPAAIVQEAINTPVGIANRVFGTNDEVPWPHRSPYKGE